VLFLLMYVIYIVLMYFNRNLEAWISPLFPSLNHNIPSMLRETKLQNMGTILNGDDLAANNNDVDEISFDTDDASKFSLCI